jgi:FSR family fosmidomycin resistance protein-like MFS transporter
MRLLRYPVFLAACLGHLSVDLLNGQMGVLLAALSDTLALSNAQIGQIAMTYALIGSLSQPFFGWLADKDGGRWTIAAGVLWMVAGYGLFAVLPAQWALGALVLASLGSGAFHPPGAAKTVQVGAVGLAGAAATAASIFFLFGQVGLSAGPAIGGFIMEHGGREGVLALAVAVLPIGVFALWAMRGTAVIARSPAVAREPVAPIQRGLLVLVIVISGLRVWAQSTITTFAPKFYDDAGLQSDTYGVLVALFMAGTAIGGVLGSSLADRWSYPRTVLGSIALSVIPFYFLPLVEGPVAFGVMFVAGLFNGGPHSILVTIAQRALPRRAGFASGLILGAQFALASLGTYLTGLLADAATLTLALQVNVALSLAAALLSVGLLWSSRAPEAEVLAPGD